MRTRHRKDCAFALILTLSLLALLVLAVFALSLLVRVGTQVATATAAQGRARQNAQLALSVALGELQRLAGPDDRVTGMAGITGITANQASTTRHWCGVWASNGAFLGWLTSGAGATTASLQTGFQPIPLVAHGSLGAPQQNSEHVIAGRISLEGGGIAYWVGDEGVKISAFSPVADLAGVAPVISDVPAASKTLRDMLEANAWKLPRVLSFEQLRVVPTTELTPGVLHDNFHHATLTSWRLVPQEMGVGRRSGTFNINTTSAIAWRGVFQAYNNSGASPQIASGALGSASTSVTTAAGPVQMRVVNNFASASGAGKLINGPFTSVDAFASSALLSNALAASNSGVTPSEFITVMRDMLTERSDTFRIRAYGDAVDPLDPTKIDATAYCEAIVQRIDAPAGGNLGRRFIILRFRWLAPPHSSATSESDV